MASRLLSDLHPAMQPLANQFLNACADAGIKLLVTCTYRSNAEQAELYAQGRASPGNIVTGTPAGKSRHNFTLDGRPASLALDIVPIVNGKAVWNTAPGPDLVLWQRVGEIGEACGLEWGGRWKSPVDFPHFQWRGNPPQ